MSKEAKPIGWTHESDERFTEYYAQASQSDISIVRFKSLRDCILRVAQARGLAKPQLDVADIGCGGGTQSILWAELGHKVHGLDVNQPLLELARRRAAETRLPLAFELGSATQLPWPNDSMDVCLLLELLEHVVDWQACLSESVRVLRPGGILFLTTSNKLCPIQQEFRLPLYSWYPKPLKRYCEKLAITTRPSLANYAKYPAVNWFTFYGLRSVLANCGFTCLDRFDVMDLAKKGGLARWIAASSTASQLVRWLAHVVTPGTTVLAIKKF